MRGGADTELEPSDHNIPNNPVDTSFKAIGKFVPSTSLKTACSAVAVGPNLALTAAHCVDTFTNTCTPFARNSTSAQDACVSGNVVAGTGPSTHRILRFDPGVRPTALSATDTIPGRLLRAPIFDRKAIAIVTQQNGTRTYRHLFGLDVQPIGPGAPVFP